MDTGKMTLFGVPYEMTEGRKNYNHYRILFGKYAKEAKNKAIEELNSNITDTEALIRNWNGFSQGIIIDYIEKAVDILIENEINNIDVDEFWEKYYERNYYHNDVIQEVISQRNSAEEECENEIAYRTARKNNRGRWEGGGFGLGGAIKGAATAGALNAISGAGHGLFNAIGNANSRSTAKSEINSLYGRYYNKLINELYINVWQIHHAVGDILSKIANIPIDYVSQKEADEAVALFNNLPKIPNEKRKKLSLIY